MDNNQLIDAKIIFKNIITKQPLYLSAYNWLAETYQNNVPTYLLKKY
jgi:hypothetical protein